MYEFHRVKSHAIIVGDSRYSKALLFRTRIRSKRPSFILYESRCALGLKDEALYILLSRRGLIIKDYESLKLDESITTMI